MYCKSTLIPRILKIFYKLCFDNRKTFPLFTVNLNCAIHLKLFERDPIAGSWLQYFGQAEAHLVCGPVVWTDGCVGRKVLRPAWTLFPVYHNNIEMLRQGEPLVGLGMHSPRSVPAPRTA